jgi:hypothetical protein
MGMGVIIAAASLGLSGVSMVQQRKAAKKSADMQQRAIDEQRKQDELRQARERRQQVREARIRSGQISQATANQGASTTSAAVGGQASIQSQLSSNLGFLDQSGSINTNIGNYMSQSNKYQAKAADWGAIGSFGSNVFSAAGGFGTIFGEGQDFDTSSTSQQYSGGVAIPSRRPVK